MRNVSMATQRELVVAIRERYASVQRGEKIKILDEFVALTGFHRKHAMRPFCEGLRRRQRQDRGQGGGLRRGCARSAYHTLGGLGSDLRQAAPALAGVP